MDFIDQIQALASRAAKNLNHVQTEEATKNALVMPFINALGYNVFDPTEVVPEYTADVGTKKGEKVDYAILREGKPIILFECKSSSTTLNDKHLSQLFRYFTVTEARIGVLTNGLTYRFYSDLEAPNKMDKRPFLVFDMLDVRENLVAELKKMAKDSFNIEEMLSSASDLKYTREIKKYLASQLVQPDEDFVKLLANNVYSGRLTQSVREQFEDIVKRAFNQLISEKISSRLKSALIDSPAPSDTAPLHEDDAEEEDGAVEDQDDGIITTDQELQGFYIVKAVLANIVDPSRVALRDTKSYCGILLDDNNRRPIIRLLFNNPENLRLQLFSPERKGERVSIERVYDLYNYSAEIEASVNQYLKD